jgi:hypothetical protein
VAQTPSGCAGDPIDMESSRAFLCIVLPLVAACSAATGDPDADSGNQAISNAPNKGVDIRILSIDCGVQMDLDKIKPGSCDEPASCGLNRKLASGQEQVCVVYSSSTSGRENNAFVFDSGTDFLQQTKQPPGSYLNATLVRSAIPSAPIDSITYDVFGDSYYHYGDPSNHPEACQNLYESESFCSPASYFVYDARGIAPSKVLTVQGEAPHDG